MLARVFLYTAPLSFLSPFSSPSDYLFYAFVFLSHLFSFWSSISLFFEDDFCRLWTAYWATVKWEQVISQLWFNALWNDVWLDKLSSMWMYFVIRREQILIFLLCLANISTHLTHIMTFDYEVKQTSWQFLHDTRVQCTSKSNKNPNCKPVQSIK